MTRLLEFREAAGKLNVPVESLRKEADKHGMTIRIGRSIRLHPDDLPKLVNLCREKPKAPAYTGAQERTERGSGKSATEQPAYRPAQAAAAKLKRSSRTTSNGNTGRVVPLGQTK